MGCSDSSNESKQTTTQVTVPVTATVATAKVSYASDILPILQQNCFECHQTGGKGEKASALNMETYAGLMKGTKYGPVINPGKSLTSTLVLLVEGRANQVIKMPHDGRPSLSDQQIQAIKAWIDQGAQNN
ncbi:MAG: c-type cytochrome [Gammaproteobacteria bacterium]|nr:c-type cytochrome [Gammaproteobacteria bacterium]